jgi:hypothetical protein
MSLLSNLIGQVESGGRLPDGPWTRPGTNQTYANGLYQQFQPFVNSYGFGAAGIDNYASKLLAANPNATLNDYYGEYFGGTGTPGALGAGGYSLWGQNGVDAQNNWARTLSANGYSPSTPLASIVGQDGSSYSPGPDGVTSAGGPDMGSTWASDSGLGRDNGSTMGFAAYGDTGSSGSGMGFPALDPQSSSLAGLGLGSGAPGVDTSGSAASAAGGASSGLGDSVSAGPAGAPVQGDLTKYSVAGVNAPIGSGEVGANAPQGNAPSSQSGTPIYETNAPQVGVDAANITAKATSQLGRDVQHSEGALAAAGTSWLGSIFAAGTSLFVRSGFVALGLVLLIGAFVFFYAEMPKAGVVNA